MSIDRVHAPMFDPLNKTLRVLSSNGNSNRIDLQCAPYVDGAFYLQSSINLKLEFPVRQFTMHAGVGGVLTGKRPTNGSSSVSTASHIIGVTSTSLDSATGPHLIGRASGARILSLKKEK